MVGGLSWFNWTHWTNMTNSTNLSNSKKGGFESLIVYHQAVEIFDMTFFFTGRFLDQKSRTKDQMEQAARSGKQNIVEGSLENSVESNLKLTGVARASFGELAEDAKDFLRNKELKLWDKNDRRNLIIRGRKIYPEGGNNWINLSNSTNLTNYIKENYQISIFEPEQIANLLVTLSYKQLYLLDQLLKAIEEKFVKEGGFRENLFKKRLDYRRKP